MRNISDKSCRENQNAYFMVRNVFTKIVPFMRPCRMMRYSRTGYRWQCNTAHELCRDTETAYVVRIAFPRQQW